MSRYELGLSTDYVENWGIIEAVREIFQNALDEEVQNPDNKMFFEYNKDSKVLIVGNKNSVLDRRSLLLGESSKRGDNATIGTHGEGYKLAILVLLRNGYNITIYNREKNEVWECKLVKSRRYNANIPVIDVRKENIFKRSENLVFEITNVSEEDFNSIVDKNIHLMKKYGYDLGEYKSCDLGTIFFDEKFKGKVFVKGLYVCDDDICYGYDFDPSMIVLDRDRSLIRSFDLYWSIGKLLRNICDAKTIKKVAMTNDGKYLMDTFGGTGITEVNKAIDSIAGDFYNKYGEDSIFVRDSDDFNCYQKAGYKNVVLLSEKNYSLVSHSSKFKKVELDKDLVPLRDRMMDWYNSYCKGLISSEGEEKFKSLISEL